MAELVEISHKAFHLRIVERLQGEEDLIIRYLIILFNPFVINEKDLILITFYRTVVLVCG